MESSSVALKSLNLFFSEITLVFISDKGIQSLICIADIFDIRDHAIASIDVIVSNTFHAVH
jgi:hypothetical protein